MKTRVRGCEERERALGLVRGVHRGVLGGGDLGKGRRGGIGGRGGGRWVWGSDECKCNCASI